MVNYMGTFIPNLSHHTEPLLAMLKKDNVFDWEDQQTRSFQQVKTLIAKANTTPLRYYDRNLLVTVQPLFSGGWEPASYSNTREMTSRSPLPARASQMRRQDMPT